MGVRRIVPNIAAADPEAAGRFYGDILGLEKVMDLGFIVTFATGGAAAPQIAFASDGGSGTPVPDISIEVDDLSIEVDDLEDTLRRMKAAKVEIEYGPADEPWGVRRFHVRDPFGRLVNILTHA